MPALSERFRNVLKIIGVLLFTFGPVIFVLWGYWSGYSLIQYSLYSLGMYGIFAIVHMLIQYRLALYSRFHNYPDDVSFSPTVTVLVPVYKEEHSLLRACLQSLVGQTYQGLQVVVSNDGDDEDTLRIFSEFARAGWRYLSDGHQGKRVAMHSGFGVIKTELVVCIDSDTILEPTAVTEIVKPFLNPKVGCATGNITVINRNENILTWLTDMRYWLAFNFERAAQSAVGVMSCVSGPLGCYRMDHINLIKDDWVNQTFLGRKCTYGDDRHLTNLILSLGFMSVYVKKANAQTQAPADFWVWIMQQLRWSRSFNREYILNWQWFYKHSLWLSFDMTYQAVFPLLLTINILLLVVGSVMKSPWYLLVWISLILVFGFIRSLYAVIFTKRPEFLAFTLYSLLYVVFLLPLKWYALFTIRDTSWGTR